MHHGSRDSASITPAWFAWGLAAVLVGVPAVAAGSGIVSQWARLDISLAAPNLRLLAQSLGWAVGIGLLATLVAWPMAWVIWVRGHQPPRWSALMVVPILLPSYLVYHSLGLARDPTTWLGGLIEGAAVAPPDGPGWYWLPVLVGRCLAFVGLSLWAWPIAAMVIVGALRECEPELIDLMRADGLGAVRRHRVMAGRVRGSIARAVGLVSLVMLGSAVPLHLANAPTISVSAWQEVTLHPGGAGVWLLTWPLVIVAAIGAWVLTGELIRGGGDRVVRGRPVNAGVMGGIAVGVLGLSTVLPLVLYAVSLRTWESVPAFLRVSGRAVGVSAGVASLVGVVGVLVCAVFWWAASVRARAGSGGVRGAVALLGFVALTPGILVGHAWAGVWAMMHAPVWIVDSPLPTVLAHSSRFAIVPALVGWMLAGLEPQGAREARVLAAGTSVGAWVRTAVMSRWPALVGAGFVTLCLSLHEIESSIVVQPPGMLSLPQTMLANLHFARQEETGAGAIVVIGAGLLVAAGAGLLLKRSRDASV